MELEGAASSFGRIGVIGVAEFGMRGQMTTRPGEAGATDQRSAARLQAHDVSANGSV
jgi:hypothetical protein